VFTLFFTGESIAIAATASVEHRLTRARGLIERPLVDGVCARADVST
jgi:hypothetical protein